MSRKSKRILLTLASAAVGAACGAAVYFIRKGKADLETDFGDFKDEFEEEEPAPAERTYTTLPKTKGAEDAARIRNLQLAMKVPKQLMQKLKAKPQSPKKKTLKKKAVRTIAKAHVKRRKLNLAMMKRILARKKQQKKLQAPQKKHRLLRIVKFLRRKKAK